MDCEELEGALDGISLKNIGGVFIVIIVGILVASFIMGFQFYQSKTNFRSRRVVDVVRAASIHRNIPSIELSSASDVASEYLDELPENIAPRKISVRRRRRTLT